MRIKIKTRTLRLHSPKIANAIAIISTPTSLSATLMSGMWASPTAIALATRSIATLPTFLQQDTLPTMMSFELPS